MTSRGLVEKDFVQIAEYLHQAVTICLNVQEEHGKILKDFKKGLVNNQDIETLRAEVEKFATSFEMPGFRVSDMKYKD
jgi:glycine hydroxymethyltransferase